MITADQIQRDFPSLKGRAYLNTAAEGIPPRIVGEALSAYWQDKLLGMDGREAHARRATDCREVAARLLEVSAAEVAFCSCTSEAYNLLATALDIKAPDEVVINDLDFPSGTTPWLVPQSGPTVKLWRSTSGQLGLLDLQQLLTQRTRLVQVSLVSFISGYRLPWSEFVATVRRWAPQAMIAVDTTQAFGRCVFDCSDADILISSTHKWALGIHGGCVVAVRAESALRLTTKVGGWYNMIDAFGETRFGQAERKPGSASYAVGMPSYAPIYALNAGLRYLENIGINHIAHHADKLIKAVHDGLTDLGLATMAPFDSTCCSGIVSFQHIEAESLRQALRAEEVHVMRTEGRIRIAVHGYNTADDVARLLSALKKALRT